MKKFKNDKKLNKLEEIRSAWDNEIVNNKNLLSFNFKYFDGSQEYGKNFSEMEQKELVDLCEDIKLTSSDTITKWRQTGIGKNRHSKLEVYGEYPANSDFSCPKSIPSQASWARIRINSNVRLVGFFLPSGKDSTEFLNIFFVVFYDPDHHFYKITH